LEDDATSGQRCWELAGLARADQPGGGAAITDRVGRRWACEQVGHGKQIVGGDGIHWHILLATAQKTPSTVGGIEPMMQRLIWWQLDAPPVSHQLSGASSVSMVTPLKLGLSRASAISYVCYKL
jgi:hypothetical protein